MGNWVNYKCWIIDKEANFNQHTVAEFLRRIENEVVVYSGFYFSYHNRHFRLEYIGKSVPLFFEDEEFKNRYDCADIYAGSGGGIDTFDIMNKPEKTRYKIDEVQLRGRQNLIKERFNTPHLQSKEDYLLYRIQGEISANTYSESIVDINNNQKKSKELFFDSDDFQLNDLSELVNFVPNNNMFINHLFDIINEFQKNEKERFAPEVDSIAFERNGRIFYEIFWDYDKLQWSTKRNSNLWPFVIVESDIWKLFEEIQEYKQWNTLP
ncbi:hypothetical protein [Lewinella cohaerens]|uniref:hypothetical protein n=1 Tax=Lewinella cohaerens TaxID=70995 RepID=UPI00035C3D61|nr:hypothetical protein [Lewinella cohaerens]